LPFHGLARSLQQVLATGALYGATLITHS
jgi:hypothetical protein